MTYPGFLPYGGTRLRLTRRKMKASEAKSIGDVLVGTSGAETLELGASNGRFVAIYMDADRGSGETDTPYKTVIHLTPDVLLYGPREAGTLTAADVNKDCDLNSADGLAVDTTTNGDFRIHKYVNSDLCVGSLNALASTYAGA